MPQSARLSEGGGGLRSLFGPVWRLQLSQWWNEVITCDVSPVAMFFTFILGYFCFFSYLRKTLRISHNHPGFIPKPSNNMYNKKKRHIWNISSKENCYINQNWLLTRCFSRVHLASNARKRSSEISSKEFCSMYLSKLTPSMFDHTKDKPAFFLIRLGFTLPSEKIHNID